MDLAVLADGPAAMDRGSFDSEAAACRLELRRYALRLTGSGADADDLVQETLLRGFKAWRTFRPGTRMAAWLRTILYRVFVDHYRDHRRLTGLAELADGTLMPGLEARTAVDPHPALHRRFLLEDLDTAMDRLSPEHREAVRLSDLEGYSGLEVAEVLGVPLGTVKSRLSRARRQLRETVTELGYGSATPT